MQSTVMIVVCPRTLMPVISTVLQCCATADLARALRAANFATSSQCLTGLYVGRNIRTGRFAAGFSR